MSIALDIFCFAISFKILFADAFSIATGVGGCGWPISTRSVLVDVAFWQFSKNSPNYASVSDVMKLLIILHYTCTGTISGGIAFIDVLDFGSRKKYPPALIFTSGSDL